MRTRLLRHAMLALFVGAAIASQATVAAGQTSPRDLKLPPGYKPPPVVTQPPMDTSTKPWTGKRLPDGQPDVQGGIWRQPMGGTGRLDNPWNGSCFNSPTCDPYKNPRPSRIVDPPDGRIPYQPWALALQLQQESNIEEPTRPEHLDTQARCLPGGVPRLNYYVSQHQILQPPGFVVFVWDAFHIYRVIRLDNAPRLASNVKLWMGDARGRWDGNTLVVETTNYNGKHRLTSRGDFHSENAKLTERFVFMDPDNVIYEATLDDPTVFTRPWTMRVAQKRSMPKGPDGEFYENACWEGNMVRPQAIDSRIAPSGRR